MKTVLAALLLISCSVVINGQGIRIFQRSPLRWQHWLDDFGSWPRLTSNPHFWPMLWGPGPGLSWHQPFLQDHDNLQYHPLAWQMAYLFDDPYLLEPSSFNTICMRKGDQSHSDDGGQNDESHPGRMASVRDDYGIESEPDPEESFGREDKAQQQMLTNKQNSQATQQHTQRQWQKNRQQAFDKKEDSEYRNPSKRYTSRSMHNNHPIRQPYHADKYQQPITDTDDESYSHQPIKDSFRNSRQPIKSHHHAERPRKRTSQEPIRNQQPYKQPIRNTVRNNQHGSLLDIANLKVPGYKPVDLRVHTKGSKLYIHGKVSCACDENCVMREFDRVYNIPEGIDTQTITATLDRDGILHLGGQQHYSHQPIRFIDTDVPVEGRGLPPMTDGDSTTDCTNHKKRGIRLAKVDARTGRPYVPEEYEFAQPTRTFEGQQGDDGVTIEVVEE